MKTYEVTVSCASLLRTLRGNTIGGPCATRTFTNKETISGGIVGAHLRVMATPTSYHRIPLSYVQELSTMKTYKLTREYLSILRNTDGTTQRGLHTRKLFANKEIISGVIVDGYLRVKATPTSYHRIPIEYVQEHSTNTETMQFKNKYFLTFNNADLTKAVFDKLRELGYEVSGPLYDETAYIRVEEDGMTTNYSHNIHDLPSTSTQATLEELFAAKPEPKETLTIGSTTYDKKEVEEALKNIKPL